MGFEREDLGMSCRTWATGRSEFPLTERERALGEDGNGGVAGVGLQVPSFGHGEFEIPTGLFKRRYQMGSCM